jgi:hypothetical protein
METRLGSESQPSIDADYCRDISTAPADFGLSTGTTAGSPPSGSKSSGTDEREWLRIGLPTIIHNASQIAPKIIAASTSVKKCAPNAIRLNPTRRTSDIALKMQSSRQCRALSAGRTKSRSCP